MRAKLFLFTLLTTVGLSQTGFADELQQLRAELSRLNSTRSQMLNDLSRVQNDLTYAQDQERRDRSEANRAEEALKQYDRDLDRARDRVNDLKNAVQRERAQKEADIQRLTSSVSSTQQQIATLDSRVTGLRSEVSQLSSQANPGQLAQFNSQLSSNTAEITKSRAEIADIERRLAELASCNSTSCTPVKLQLQRNRDALNAKIADLENKNNELRRQISTLQNAINILDAKKRELSQAESQLSNLRSQLPQLQSQLEEARRRPIQSESELVRAEQALRALDGQRPGLELRARQTREQWERSRGRVDEVARIEQNIRYQIRDVDSNIDRIQRRIAELEAGQSGGRRAAIIGNNLSSQLSYDISQMGMDKINVDTTTLSSSSLYSYKSSFIYLFAESIYYSIDSTSGMALEQFVREGGVLVLVGDYSQLGLSAQLVQRSMCAYTLNSQPAACY